jgi:enamine deaminase RidA (YjgF/YER057c/UK114 family)
MTLELLNPAGLPTPDSYTQVVGRALAAGGAGPEHVARITIYVVHHRPEYLPRISEARIALFGDHKPADTIIGVETLAEPGYLIEVEAIAVVD